MARGRYIQNDLFDRTHYSTYTRRFESMGLKVTDLLQGISCVDYYTVAGDRLDIIAHKFYGDDGQWWVIAMANNINYPLGIPVGTLLRMPRDIKDVTKKLFL